MCYFEIPQLLLYTHIPVLIASVVFGVFIFLADKKNSINRNLLIVILFYCFWVIDTLLQWLTYDVQLNLFFSQLSIFEFVSLVFFVYFTHAFVGDNLGWKKKLLFFLPFIPIVTFAFTGYNLTIDHGTCETQTGPLYTYLAVLTLTYLAYIVYFLLKKYKKASDEKIKNQIKLIVGAIMFLIGWFLGFSYLIDVSVNYGYGDDISQFMPFGMLVFLWMLTYAITKYQLFNIKLVAANVLTITIWLLIGSQLFFTKGFLGIALTLLTLLFSIILGRFLVRSVREEVKRKEELQKISDSLAVANERLKVLDNAKSEFISIASHQLRTPLTAIKGYASLLLEGAYGQVSAPIHDVLEKMYKVNSGLVQLVEDLLSISRIEAGRIQYTFESTQIEAVVMELVDMFSLMAKNKHLSLKMNLPKKTLPMMLIDANKIKEVISNLIDNALKYTIEGGVVVTLENGGDVARVIVSDTGIGIRPEDRNKLFEKFTRSTETTKMVVSGTGLGLYVGKNFVTAHGGRIWAESEGHDTGSRFIVELPFVNLKAKAGVSDQAAPMAVR